MSSLISSSSFLLENVGLEQIREVIPNRRGILRVARALE